MGGEKVAGAGNLQRYAEGLAAAFHEIMGALKHRESSVTLI
jgi:hypothetical protein